MSLEAVRVKEEPSCAATDDIIIKAEPELNEAEWVNNEAKWVNIEAEWVNNEAEYMPQLCAPLEVCVQLEPACTKQEPCVPPQVVCELGPVYTKLETVCFNDEPIIVQQPDCVKEEPPWQESVPSELDQGFKYAIPLQPGPPPTGTPDAPCGSSCALLQDHLYASTEYTPADVKRINWDCFVRLERCVVPRSARLRFQRAAAAGRAGAAADRVSRAHERQIAIRQLSGSLIRRIDKTEDSYSCQICKKQYKSLACLTTHKLGHTKNTRSKRNRSGKNTYFCEICKLVFHDFDSLKVHALVHAKVTIPLYFCDICHKEFATNYALRTHKRVHEHARPFKCHICKQRFSRKIDLSRHFAAHRSQKPFCKGCEKKQAIKQLGDLMRSEHGQTSENTDFCELCNNYV